MLIGSCRDCNEICSETSRNSFDRTHQAKKHSVAGAKEFIDDNEAFIEKVQKTWKTFDLNLQHFFKSLHTKLEKIEKESYERIIEEELKTAVNSNDKRVIQLARNVLNERFKDLTCREIEEFVEIKKRQEGNPNFLCIQKKEEDFAFDILDEIKRSAYDLGKNLYDTKKKPQKTFQIPQPQRPRNVREKMQVKVESPSRQEPSRRQQDRKDRKREEPPRREAQRNTEKRQPNNKEDKREERPARERRQERPERQRRQERPARQERQERRPAMQERQERPARQDRQRRPRRQPRQDRNIGKRQDGEPNHRQRRRGRAEQNEGKYIQKTFKKVKIGDLKQSGDELSLQFKLISFVKNVKDRDVWLVGDETGQIKLIIPNHESFKPRVAIALNNCYVKEFHGQLQLYAKLFSTITSAALGNDVDVGSLQRDNRERPQRRKQTAPIAITKISNIQPGMQDMKIIAKVVSAQAKGQFAQCVLGDETGIVNARFKSSEFLKEGNSIYCRGVSSDIDGTVQGTIYLFQGSRFLIQNAREGVRKVNKELNVSFRVYLVQDDQ